MSALHSYLKFSAALAMLAAALGGAARADELDLEPVVVTFWGQGPTEFGDNYMPDGTLSIRIFEESLATNPQVSGVWRESTASGPWYVTSLAEDVRMIPGKSYAVQIQLSYMQGEIDFFATSDSGYELVFDGGPFYNGTAHISAGTYQMKVMPRGDPNTGHLGSSTSLSPSKLHWELFLGKRWNGRSAGSLVLMGGNYLHDWGLAYTPALLVNTVSSTGSAYYSPANVAAPEVPHALRQLRASDALVDIVTTSATSYEIRLYTPSQATGSAFPYTFSGAPHTVYALSKGSTERSLTIHKKIYDTGSSYPAVPTQTLSTSVVRTGTWPNIVWTVDDWHVLGQTVQTRHVRTFSQVSYTNAENYTLKEAIVVKGPAPSETVAMVGHRLHKKYPWGESVIEEHIGPTGSELTTVNTFEETIASDKGKLRSVALPGGGWKHYEYVKAGYSGMPNGGYVTYEPFLDLPATPGTSATGKVVKRWNTPAGRPVKRDVERIETHIGGQLQSKTVYVETFDLGIGTYFSSSPPVDRVVEQEYYGTGPADYLPTTTRNFRVFQNGSHDHVPFSKQYPDGSKTVIAYHGGTYDAASHAFTVASPGGFFRISEISGTAAEASPTTSASLATYEGATLVALGDTSDSFYVTPGYSDMRVRILDGGGNVLRAERRIWTGAAWELVSWENFQYNKFGRLTLSQASNGDTYEATYVGELKTSETDEDGIIRSFEYDSANQLTKTTRAGSILPGDPTPAVSILYGYDAAGRTASTTVAPGPAPAEQLASATLYDTAGRVVSEKGPNAPATTYAYNVPARAVTATYPHGATRIEGRHRDGRLKSVTGGSAVSEFHTYAAQTLDARPVLYARVNYGSSASPRLVESWTDMLGRTVKTSAPGFAGTDPADPASVSRSYFNAKGQLVRTSTTGYADTLYEYNVFGQLVRSGLDINADGDLDIGLTDRVTETESAFEKIGSDWWTTTTTHGYLLNGSSTSSLLSTTRQRLSGHPAGQRSETQTTDADGAVTTVKTTVIRANANVRTETTRPGHTLSAIQLANNGLPYADRSRNGVLTTRRFDALGRLIAVNDPLIGQTVTAYKPGTTLPGAVTQPNGDQTQTLYDSFGRASETKDPLGRSTYYGYDAFGRQDRVWGPGSNPSKHVYDATYGDLHRIVTWRGTASDWNDAAWPSTAPTDYQQITTFQTDAASGLLRSKTYSGGDSVVYGYDARRQVDYRSRVVESATTASTVTYSYDPGTGALASQSYVPRAEDEPTPGLSYGYDRAGRVTSITDAAGTRTYAYEPAKPWRLASETLGATLGSRRLAYQYQTPTDTNGLAGRASGYELGTAANPDAEASAVWAYDDKGRLSTVTAYGPDGAASNAYAYAYLANTRLVESLTSASHSIAWARETDSHRLLSVDTKWGSASLARFDYAYTARGQRDWAKASGASLALDGGPVTHDYQYDDRGQLTKALAYKGDQAAIGTAGLKMPNLQFEYSYDHAGNLLRANRSGSAALAEARGYAEADRIATRQTKAAYLSGSAASGAPVATHHSLAAALAGRQGSYWSAAVAPANASGPATLAVDVYARQGSSVSKKTAALHVGAASQALSHDPDGNLLSDGIWELKYDAEHRLTKAATTAAARAAGIPAWEVRHRYDHQGRRFERQQLLDGAVQETRRYVHQGWNIVAEYTVSGSTLTLDRSYAWGLDLAGSGGATGGVGALLQIQDHHNGPEPAGQASYDEGGVYRPAWDGIGNLVALYKDGVEAAVYEYSPYGELLRSRGPYAQHNRIRYGSKLADPLTGLIDFGYRHYSPLLGRFVTRDPIAEAGGLNLYQYAGNDPVNRIDVLGLQNADPDNWTPPRPRPYYWPRLGVDGGWQDLRDFLQLGVERERRTLAWNKNIDESQAALAEKRLQRGTREAPKASNGWVAEQEGGSGDWRFYEHPPQALNSTGLVNYSEGQPAPTQPNGEPAPPPAPLPPGKDGKPNSWRPIPGTGNRPIKWVPTSPIPGQSQPGASWDPEGHWDVDDGKGTRGRYGPDGRPITPGEAHGGNSSFSTPNVSPRPSGSYAPYPGVYSNTNPAPDMTPSQGAIGVLVLTGAVLSGGSGVAPIVVLSGIAVTQ